jgi:ethylbenzene dioxygenase subunit beta
VRRLRNDRNWSQQPITRSVRVIGNILIDGSDASGRIIVRSCMQYAEHRLEQRLLAGEVLHKLESDGSGGWKVYLKRVNLVNCDGVQSILEVFL